MIYHNQSTAPPRGRSLAARLLSGGFAALSLVFILMASEAQAATPTAGSSISNQASATYTDADNVVRKSNSNTVITTVDTVGSYTLITDNNKMAAAGTTVYMPHTLTNTGNSADEFKISLSNMTTNQAANLSAISVFLDNGSGNPSSTTPICTITSVAVNGCTNVPTGTLQPGDTYKFVVSMVVKATALHNTALTIANTDQEIVTAVPMGITVPLAKYATATRVNNDELTINNLTAVINVTKEIVGVTSGPVGTTVTYRLNYTNSGNAAGPLYIQDVIGSAGSVGYNYVADSGRWSNPGVGVAVMTDALDSQNNGSQYEAAPLPSSPASQTSVQTTIKAAVYAVPATSTGYFEFKVFVLNSAALGTSTTGNIATFGTPTTCTVDTTACTPPTSTSTSNKVDFTVTGVYDMVANNASASTTDGDNVTPTGADLVLVPTAVPGSTVSFVNYIHNKGNATDTYNISIGSITAGLTMFPTGTTFQLFKNDGSSPLIDTNGDTSPDTGPIAPGGYYAVILTATLPANATAGGPYTKSVTATSITNSISNSVFDQVGTIVTAGLTLTADSSNQIYPGGTVVYSHTLHNIGNATCGVDTTGATPVGFDFVVTNDLGSAGWQYTLWIDNNGNGQVDSATDTLLGGGSTDGTVSGTPTINGTATSLLTINSGVTKTLLVKVQAPAGANPGPTPAADVDHISVTAIAKGCANVTGTLTTTPITDITTVVLGQVRVDKTQALGAWNGTACAATTGTYTSAGQTQKPGECIWYKIIATNQGSANVKDVSLTDATPAFTTYANGKACSAGESGAGLTPAAGATGSVSCGVWTTLTPSATVQMDFAVRIDP